MTSTSLTSFMKAAQKTVEKANRLSGKMIFALDASASRDDTWSNAQKMMRSLFAKVAELGDMKMMLGFFRGSSNFRQNADISFSGYVNTADEITALMEQVTCSACSTEIGKLFAHCVLLSSDVADKPACIVYVGDAREDSMGYILQQAKLLGAFKVPIFMFLDSSRDTNGGQTEEDFKRIAVASNGAFAKFDENSPAKMEELLASAMAFATGGLRALEKRAKTSEAATLLLTQLK